MAATVDISIHSLRMEGDGMNSEEILDSVKFQSTPSAWRETRKAVFLLSLDLHFNPLPPHGGRPILPGDWITRNHFNPLPPHGGRHAPLSSVSARISISIHSLRMEGDNAKCAITDVIFYFNPLPPHGGRLHFHFVLPPNF